MARRTSLPRLNINADVRIARDCKPILTPLLPTNRLVNKPPLISMVGLVARNREAGAPVVPAAVDETVEDFPYQNGPKEILPRLFLGSEQNAKDPQLLRTLGITSIICVAKEVLCPWLAEEAIEEEGSDTDGSDSSHSDDESSRPVSQSTAHLKVSALLVPPSSHMAYSVSQHNNPPTAPVRPLYVRPTASTPNLQQRFHQAAPSTGKASSSAPRELFAASTVQCKGDSAFTHSGYLSRHFPANHLTGRPAIEYTKLPWSHDEDEIASCFQTHKICELIDRSRQAGGRCLVHCQLGVSRSATLVIGYCMRQAARGVEQGTRDLKSMHDSYTFVRSKSRWVAPNIGLLVRSFHSHLPVSSNYLHFLSRLNSFNSSVCWLRSQMPQSHSYRTAILRTTTVSFRWRPLSQSRLPLITCLPRLLASPAAPIVAWRPRIHSRLGLSLKRIVLLSTPLLPIGPECLLKNNYLQ